jgi:glycosyltransferase involved in cell wall biosynthesis
MLRFHPHRLGAQLRRGPDWAIYPLYLLGVIPAIAAGIVVSPLAPLAYGALLVIPLLRHLTYAAPGAIVVDHLIQGAGTLIELLSPLVPAAPTILHYPYDPGPYQAPLNVALAAIRVRSAVLRGPSPLQSLNLAMLPLTLASARIRGTRIWHLHWTWGFIPGARLPNLGRRLFRAWFGVLLQFAHLIGLRVVWTAHNLLPHQPVFDDDIAARHTLIAAVDAIVVHDKSTADELFRRFGKTPHMIVVRQGPPPLAPLPTRDAARTRLEINSRRFVLLTFGRVAHYKGLDTLISAVGRLSAASRERLAVRIIGQPDPINLGPELESIAASTDRVAWTFDFQFFTDERLAEELAAADLAVFPFRSIANSGSLVTALSVGLPSLIADHPSLVGYRGPAVRRYGPPEDARALAEALEELLARSPDELLAASASARAEIGDWAVTAKGHRDLYAQLLQGTR